MDAVRGPPVQGLELADDQLLEPVRLRLERRPGLVTQVGPLSPREHDPQLLDLVADRAVAQRTTAGGVNRDHPADSRDVGIPRDRLEPAAEGRELGIELVGTTPASTTTRSGSIAMTRRRCRLRSMTRPGPERAAAGVGPGPAGMDRDPVLGRVPDGRHHVVLGPWHDHAQRIDFEDAGVVRVRRTIEGREVQLPFDDVPQIVVDPRPAFIHFGGRSSNPGTFIPSTVPRGPLVQINSPGRQ